MVQELLKWSHKLWEFYCMLDISDFLIKRSEDKVMQSEQGNNSCDHFSLIKWSRDTCLICTTCTQDKPQTFCCLEVKTALTHLLKISTSTYRVQNLTGLQIETILFVFTRDGTSSTIPEDSRLLQKLQSRLAWGHVTLEEL